MQSIEIPDKVSKKIKEIQAEHNDYTLSEISAALIELGITLAGKVQNTPDVDKSSLFSMLLASCRKRHASQDD